MASSPQAIASAALNLIQQAGIKVMITSLDGTAAVSTVCVFARTTSNPQATGSSVQKQSRIVIPARLVPQVGDYVRVNSTDYRIKTVEAIYVKGKPVLYTLDLT
jgi:hypothetical protein